VNSVHGFPDHLRKGVWHVTSADRFASIKEIGKLLPEPNIPNDERWSTGSGHNFYPYVRHIGGVSLFDFSRFDEATYNDEYPVSQWRNFVPCPARWNKAIWIQFSVELLSHGYVDPGRLLDRWRTEASFSHKIMPLIEAAYIGPLELRIATTVWEYRDDGWREWSSLELP